MGINKQAKKYKHQIVEYYSVFKVPFKLTLFRTFLGLIQFLIEFVPGTTENKLRQYLGDVRQTLQVQIFELYKEDTQLFFVISKNKIFDNRLLGILTSPSYEERIKGMTLPYSIGFKWLSA
jgi:hypothetical protein